MELERDVRVDADGEVVVEDVDGEAPLGAHRRGGGHGHGPPVQGCHVRLRHVDQQLAQRLVSGSEGK